MSQPIDLEAAAQFNELLRALVLRIADEEEDRRWREHSFFRRFGMHPGM